MSEQKSGVYMGFAEPVLKWSRPYSFEEWKEATLQGQYSSETLLRELYAKEWDPVDCHEYMLCGKLFMKPPKYRRRKLDLAAVQGRIATAIWRECGKLLTRNMEPDARAFVCQTQASAEKAAGIEILGRVGLPSD